MLRSSALFAPLLVPVLLTACGGSKVAPTGLSQASFASMLEGTWSDEGDARYTFERRGSVAVATAVVDSDGEAFTVTDAGTYGPDGFAWTYEVPSTGYVVTHTITALSNAEFTARWANQADTGTSVFSKE
jgi:hypothetical protein